MTESGLLLWINLEKTLPESEPDDEDDEDDDDGDGPREK